MSIKPASLIAASRVSRTIVDRLDGERVVALVPDLAPTVDNGWWQHPNLYTGRALGEQPFVDEQNERGARLALRGRMVTTGVVLGMEIDLEVANLSQRFLHVAPGHGICASGEELTLTAPIRVDLAHVPVVDAGAPFDAPDPDAEQPRPPVSVVVMTPVTAQIVAHFDDEDPCEEDPSKDAFADWQRVDGFKLRLVRWPAAWPLPPSGLRRRNLLASAIFAAEAALAPDEVLPWEALGLPIALVGLGSADDTFVDRAAVVRAGGHPRRRSAIVPAPSLVLRQARMQQLAEQLNDLAAVPMDQLEARFRQLPPSGVLPARAVQLRPTQNVFFPESFRLECVPIPTEQLDAALKASASLQPFDLDVPDFVRVLVPVPQAYWEPRLLATETIDPAFQAAIDHFLTEVGLRRANRDALWQLIHDATERIYGTDKTSPVPTSDPGAVAEEQPIHDPTDPETEAVDALRTTYAADVDKIGAALKLAPLSAEEQALFVAATMPPVPPLNDGLDALKARIDKADDAIDFGFLRAQTDIYRIRQQMLGADVGTRLATSPALAGIARGETAFAVRQDLSDFFAKAIKTKVVNPPPPPPPPLRAPVLSILRSPFLFRAAPVTPSILRFAAAPAAALGVTRVVDEPALSPRLIGVIGRGGGIGGIGGLGVGPGGPPVVITEPPPPPPDAVTEQAPLPGADIVMRTTAVAERVQESPSVDARNYAVRNKHDSVVALLDSSINLDEVPVPNQSLVNGDAFTVSGQRFIVGTNAVLITEGPFVGQVEVALDPANPNAKTRVPALRTVSTFRDVADYAGRAKLATITDEYPPPANADEAAVYSNVIAAIEDVIRMFRFAEGIVARYRNALGALKAARDALQALLGEANARLATVERELDEQRHDLATARALKLDEGQRIAGVNERRDAVIAQYVRFLAYQRPRTTDAVLAVPSRTLDPALSQSVIPQCLADHGATPSDLQALIELFREGPVRWFPALDRIVDELDRLEMQQRLLYMARLRAYTRYQLPNSPWTWQASAGRFSEALDGIFSAQRTVLETRRLRVAQLDLDAFQTLSWQDIRVHTRENVSIGDLIDGGHGRADLSQRAATELGNLAAVASCLHARLSQVLPRIRLEWAEQLSQYQSGVSLRNLAALPRWGELPFIDRHEMQEMADWLYGQVDLGVAEATSLMHDLVRVCVLLASHAPVNQIIAGHVHQPAPATKGGRLQIVVDPVRVRVGMDVLVYTRPDRPQIRATVEDVNGGFAAARILEVESGVVNVPKGAAVHFQHPMIGYTPQSYR